MGIPAAVMCIPINVMSIVLSTCCAMNYILAHFDLTVSLFDQSLIIENYYNIAAF